MSATAKMSLGPEVQPHSTSGRMFIGGLHRHTTAPRLRAYFNKFGNTTEATVVMDQTTGRSRGFGFVTFSDPASTLKVLAKENHFLDGKQIDPKFAFPAGRSTLRSNSGSGSRSSRTGKIFVGGLYGSTKPEDLRTYFGQFGPIVNVFTNTSQGYGFVTFAKQEIADKVCENRFHVVDNNVLECKLPNRETQTQYNSANSPWMQSRQEQNPNQAFGSNYHQVGLASVGQTFSNRNPTLLRNEGFYPRPRPETISARERMAAVAASGYYDYLMSLDWHGQNRGNHYSPTMGLLDLESTHNSSFRFPRPPIPQNQRRGEGFNLF